MNATRAGERKEKETGWGRGWKSAPRLVRANVHHAAGDSNRRPPRLHRLRRRLEPSLERQRRRAVSQPPRRPGSHRRVTLRVPPERGPRRKGGGALDVSYPHDGSSKRRRGAGLASGVMAPRVQHPARRRRFASIIICVYAYVVVENGECESF